MDRADWLVCGIALLLAILSAAAITAVVLA
jgi:hypothetical protein